jgi:hypothetical protein
VILVNRFGITAMLWVQSSELERKAGSQKALLRIIEGGGGLMDPSLGTAEGL